MDYKPYTAEWSRKRYLSESIQKYFEDGVPASVIAEDIVDTLEYWADLHRSQADKINDVLSRLK
jgi:hypothetical protein